MCHQYSGFGLDFVAKWCGYEGRKFPSSEYNRAAITSPSCLLLLAHCGGTRCRCEHIRCRLTSTCESVRPSAASMAGIFRICRPGSRGAALVRVRQRLGRLYECGIAAVWPRRVLRA